MFVEMLRRVLVWSKLVMALYPCLCGAAFFNFVKSGVGASLRVKKIIYLFILINCNSLKAKKRDGDNQPFRWLKGLGLWEKIILIKENKTNLKLKQIWQHVL